MLHLPLLFLGACLCGRKGIHGRHPATSDSSSLFGGGGENTRDELIESSSTMGKGELMEEEDRKPESSMIKELSMKKFSELDDWDKISHSRGPGGSNRLVGKSEMAKEEKARKMKEKHGSSKKGDNGMETHLKMELIQRKLSKINDDVSLVSNMMEDIVNPRM